jgi:hypothetical protein
VPGNSKVIPILIWQFHHCTKCGIFCDVHILLLPQSDESITVIALDCQVGNSGKQCNCFGKSNPILFCLVIFGNYNIIFMQCATSHHRAIYCSSMIIFYDKNNSFLFCIYLQLISIEICCLLFFTMKCKGEQIITGCNTKSRT